MVQDVKDVVSNSDFLEGGALSVILDVRDSDSYSKAMDLRDAGARVRARASR